MRVVRLVRAWTHRHPDLAELALGVTVAASLLVVSLSQWGLTDVGLSRGVTLGLPFAVAIVWASRRRRLRDEGRDRAMLEQRLQLARELHDAVAGQVAVVGIQAAAARRVLTTRPDEASQALERIEIASRAAVDDLRRMLVTLREGPAAPTGAAPGLAQLDDLLSELRRAGLTVTTTRNGMSSSGLPQALDQAGYRIVQEALTNALKHGGAGTASLDLARSDDRLEIRVTNPVGTHVTAATLPDERHRGLGVTGILERASLFGGHAEAGPTRDGQWLVSVELPLAGGGRA
jgi:signal transduction histidine kinase